MFIAELKIETNLCGYDQGMNLYKFDERKWYDCWYIFMIGKIQYNYNNI